MNLQITARDIPVNDPTKEKIRERAHKLERHFDRITSCRVVIESPHKHHRNGRPYNVRIDLTLPGHELVVTGEVSRNLTTAVTKAFDAAKRQIEDHVRTRRR